MSSLMRRLTEAASSTGEASSSLIEQRVFGHARPRPQIERAVRDGVAVEHGRGLV